MGEPLFPNVVGLVLEEVRVDYGRMRLPYRPELRQPEGMVHGGAIATLIDTVIVPAVGSAYDEIPVMLTIDLQIRFLDVSKETDLVAEGWVTRRGRSISFCQAEVSERSTTRSWPKDGWSTKCRRPSRRCPNSDQGNGVP